MLSIKNYFKARIYCELTVTVFKYGHIAHDICHRYITYTVESRFLEPPGETQIGSRNREFEKSKVASNYP